MILGAGSLVLPDDKATESGLKTLPLRDFKIIHLALHGFGDVVELDRARLALAPGGPTRMASGRHAKSSSRDWTLTW